MQTPLAAANNWRTAGGIADVAASVHEFNHQAFVTIHTSSLMRLSVSRLMVECAPALGLLFGRLW